MKGVTPEADRFSFTVPLSQEDRAQREQVIERSMGIADKVDVLNLSLGNNVNGSYLPLSVALNHAVDHGITAVTSSGIQEQNIWTIRYAWNSY